MVVPFDLLWLALVGLLMSCEVVEDCQQVCPKIFSDQCIWCNPLLCLRPRGLKIKSGHGIVHQV